MRLPAPSAPLGLRSLPRLCAAVAALLGTACNVSTSGPFDGENGERVEGLTLNPVVSGLAQPTYLTAPEGDPRLFITERSGAIRVVAEGGTLRSAPFLDLSAEVTTSGSEQGLLGMAFHPDYAENGRFFVDYTDNEGDTRVVEYSADPSEDVADAGSGSLILHVEQPQSNHNGGQVSFGPDGYLYIGLGDGGGSGDPDENGQNPGTLLGTILRIDVDGGTPYAIPPDNPFVGNAEARDEIWAYGLRNPWRFAWDPIQDLFYVADVGQERWEEVNIVSVFDAGVNFGWRTMEGPDCYIDPVCLDDGLHIPEIVYTHQVGCSVTGGLVYRGLDLEEIAGQYLFGDYCEGWIRAAAVEDQFLVGVTQLGFEPPGSITSFGEDARGEIYVLVAEGTVYKLVRDVIEP